MSKTIVELRNTPDDVLIAEHDALAVHTVIGVNYYLDEIRRREAAQLESTMIRPTWAIAVLTFVVTVATIINLPIFIVSA